MKPDQKFHLKYVTCRAKWLCNTSKGSMLKSTASRKWLSTPYLHGVRGRNGHSENLEFIHGITLPCFRSWDQFHPLKSQCMCLWNLVAISSISMFFYKLPSQEYNMKMYKVTQSMQVAQDALKLLPNLLAICAEDMMHIREACERVKTLSTRKQIQ